jgi:hypothetical protein
MADDTIPVERSHQTAAIGQPATSSVAIATCISCFFDGPMG